MIGLFKTMSEFVTQAEFEAYKKEAEKKFGNEKKVKKTRQPNQYNIFVKEEIARLKAEKPGLPNQEALKLAAHNWKAKKSQQ